MAGDSGLLGIHHGVSLTAEAIIYNDTGICKTKLKEEPSTHQSHNNITGPEDEIIDINNFLCTLISLAYLFAICQARDTSIGTLSGSRARWRAKLERSQAITTVDKSLSFHPIPRVKN